MARKAGPGPRVAGYRFRRDAAYREVDGEYHVLSADSVYHCVSDPVGTFILDAIRSNPGIGLDELVIAVEGAFDAPGVDVAADVHEFVSTLLDRGVIETNGMETDGRG